MLAGPPRGGGGDTHWSSQYGAYDLLSPSMQKYLEGLTALHSSALQDSGSRALGRPIRRESVETEHPLVRVNPVTSWKSLYYNPGFVTAIVGVPKTESDHIMSYLNEIIATTQEIHCRFQWGKYDVAFWDNRICVRHLWRRLKCIVANLVPESYSNVWIQPSSSSCNSRYCPR